MVMLIAALSHTDDGDDGADGGGGDGDGDAGDAARSSGSWYRGPDLTFFSPNLLKPQPPSKSQDKEMCSHSRAIPSFPSQLEWKIGLAWANTRGSLNSPS